MKQYVDKVVLFAVCTVCFLVNMNSFVLPVVIALSAAIASFLCSLEIGGEYAKYFRIGINSVYVLICLFRQEFIFMLPVLAYDCFLNDIRPMLAVYALASVFLSSSVGIRDTAILLFLAAAAVLMCISTKKQSFLEAELIKTRDEITGRNILLAKKNKQLTENQDYEIRLATLNERTRIAGDIHDNVGHMLSRLILQVGAMLAVEKDGGRRENLESVQDTLNQAMTSIRKSVHDLHEETVDISDAVLDAVSILPVQIKRDVCCEKITDMPVSVKYCLISAVKECMSNIVKHSNATAVTVTLREHPAFFQLLIKDNGTKLSESDGCGMGLDNMRERVNALGGTFTVDSSDGYRVFISIKK